MNATFQTGPLLEFQKNRSNRPSTTSHRHPTNTKLRQPSGFPILRQKMGRNSSQMQHRLPRYFQGHLRSSIIDVGQIELGCPFVAENKEDLILLHLSSQNETIMELKAAQNIPFAAETYPHMICRAASLNFSLKITWFSLKLYQIRTVWRSSLI